MPPTREELDLQLLKFLREQETRERRIEERRQREEEGVKTAIGNVAAQVQILGTKLDSNHAIVSERLAGLASRVESLEKDAEDTGVHNLERLKEERDAAIEGKRDAWKIAAAAVLSLVSGGGVVELLHRIH